MARNTINMSRSIAGTRTVATQRKVPGVSLNKCADFSLDAKANVSFTVPASMDPANMVNFTFAVWLYPKEIDSLARRIIDNITTGAGFYCQLPNTGLDFRVQYHTIYDGTILGAGIIKVGKWQRLLVTWNNASGHPNIYLNSVLQTRTGGATKSGVRDQWSGSVPIIGNSNATTGNRNFGGLMDEFCIWNRILTPTEINDDFFKAMAPVSTNGLLLRYAMDETSGNLVDASGNSITGTPYNLTQNVASYSIPARTAA